MADLPATVTELPAGAGDGGELPGGAVTLANDAEPEALHRCGPAGRTRPAPVLHRGARPAGGVTGAARGCHPAYLGFNLFGQAIARAVIHGTYEQK